MLREVVLTHGLHKRSKLGHGRFRQCVGAGFFEAVVEGTSCDPLLVGSTTIVTGNGAGTCGTGIRVDATVLT